MIKSIKQMTNEQVKNELIKKSGQSGKLKRFLERANLTCYKEEDYIVRKLTFIGYGHLYYNFSKLLINEEKEQLSLTCRYERRTNKTIIALIHVI